MSDPQPVMAPKNQTYGVAGEQEAAQKVIPVAGQPAPPTGGGDGVAQGPQAPTQLPGMGPGEVPTLSDPSVQPGTPVQDGLPGGPGRGPQSIQTAALDSDLTVLQQINKLYPSTALAHLIDFHRERIMAAETPQTPRGVVPRPPMPQVQGDMDLDSQLPPELMAEDVGADGTPMPVNVEDEMMFEDAGTGVPTDAPMVQAPPPAAQPAQSPQSPQPSPQPGGTPNGP